MQYIKNGKDKIMNDEQKGVILPYERYETKIGEIVPPVGQDLTTWVQQTESAIVQMQKQLTRLEERLITFEDQVNYVKRFQEEYKPISIDNLIKRVDKLVGEADGKTERLKWETDRADEAIKVISTFSEKMIQFDEYKDKLHYMVNYLQGSMNALRKNILEEVQENFVQKEKDHDA
jgi:uncharacterized coiled-coil DUF342 family protein